MVVFNIFMAMVLVLGLFTMTMGLCGGARDDKVNGVHWTGIPAYLKKGWLPWRRWAAVALYSSDTGLAATYWPFKFMAKWWYKSWGLNVSFYQRKSGHVFAPNSWRVVCRNCDRTAWMHWCFRDGYRPSAFGIYTVGAQWRTAGYSYHGNYSVGHWQSVGYVEETPKKRMKTW